MSNKLLNLNKLYSIYIYILKTVTMGGLHVLERENSPIPAFTDPGPRIRPS